MRIVGYLSNIAIPFSIILIITYGLLQKKKVFDIFLDGAKEGLEIVLKIFPSLVGLFVAIGALRSSGILDAIIKLIFPISSLFRLPNEIMPLVLLRPISGSASLAVATDIMKINGVDSQIGKIVSTIMGATETTLYTIAIYTGVAKIKKTRFVLLAALAR